jgi:iron complex outermembrane receptor protein
VSGAAALLCCACGAAAQTQQAPIQLPRVVVTGNPLGSDLFEMIPPVSTLEGERLQQNRQPTLGEMLSGLPGVNSTYYGPNASRPVIRGFDGDRIRILQNGTGTIDASGTSVDHAVSVDTLTVKRVEVVRGPATLLYGPTALGGVVNVIDGRIPDARVEGATGAVDLRYASPASERAVAAASDVGTSQGLVLHGDVFKVRTDDLKIPDFARSARLRELDPLPSDEEPRGTLPNSASDTRGGAVGGSYVGNKGYLGASYAEFKNDYGTVAEEDVTIRMKQKRVDLAGALNDPANWIKSAKFKFTHSDYQHTEFEGDEPGTTFKNKGYEGRLDIVHNRLGAFDGAFGFQIVDFDFSALGEEAFLPQTHTQSVAGFIFEQTKWNDWTFQAGGRIERTEVKADADPQFGPAEKRNFTTGAISLGVLYALSPDYVIASSVVATQRPPNYQELYADGPHLATGQFLIGDRTFGVEKSVGFDVSLRKRRGPITGSVGFFYNRFSNFITQFPTGETNEEFDLPVFVYRQTRAELYGVEFEGRLQAGHYGPGDLSFEVQGDWLRATDLDAHQPLPRISPLRIGGAVVYGTDRWNGRLDVMRVQKQDRVAENELPTDGYTMLNASLDYKLGISKIDLYAFVKGTNLLNEDARNHVSVLKDIAPMGKRGITVVLRGTF